MLSMQRRLRAIMGTILVLTSLFVAFIPGVGLWGFPHGGALFATLASLCHHYHHCQTWRDNSNRRLRQRIYFILCYLRIVLRFIVDLSQDLSSVKNMDPASDNHEHKILLDSQPLPFPISQLHACENPFQATRIRVTCQKTISPAHFPPFPVSLLLSFTLRGRVLYVVEKICCGHFWAFIPSILIDSHRSSSFFIIFTIFMILFGIFWTLSCLLR